MSHRFIIRAVTAAIITFTLGALSPAPTHAETQATPFAFGPGTDRPTRSNDSATLTVPARTTARVKGVLNPIQGLIPISVVIDVIRPEGGSPAASISTAAAPLGISVPFEFLVETFTSQVGCPSSWTVRVRTANNSVPPSAVRGSVTFDFQKPGAVNLDMVGDALSLAPNGSVTKNLAGHDVLGIANNTLIAGTGTFKIKAKWDTDLSDVLHFNQFFRVTVDLLRPDGTRAAGETGFSQHGSSTPKVDFSYTVTSADAAMTGSWKVRITNNVLTNGGQVKIVNFDIENLLLPTFNSTFQAACN
jgi:hypothetical protein